MTAEIIAVGTELLLGEIVNTNAQFLSQQLANLGIGVHFQSVVGDNPKRLVEALRSALSRSDIVITTGGLGPTADDLTKETICKAVGKELVLFEDQLAILEKRFAFLNCTMTANNKKQVMFPKDAVILPNDRGTAPGCVIKGGRQMIFMLPGPPSEMKHMFLHYVAPILQSVSDRVIRSRRMEFFGIGESLLETKLSHLMEGENPTVAPYAKMGQVSVRVTASAETAAECDAMCSGMMDKINEIVGEHLYGYDDASMEQVLMNLLQEWEATVAIGEFGSGGAATSRFAAVDGSDRLLKGSFIFADEEDMTNILGVEEKVLRREGAVSPAAAARVAIRSMCAAGSDLGLSFCIGADGTAYVGVCGFGNVFVKELDLKGHHDLARMRQIGATHLFDLVRRLMDEKLEDTLESICVFKEELSWKNTSNIAVANVDRSASKGKTGILLVIAAVCALVILAGYLIIGVLRPSDGSPTAPPSSQASSLPQSQDSPISQYMEKIGAAYMQNEDVVGYLTCGGIDTPLVQGQDNEYYLNHGLTGEGAIPFVDYRSQREGGNKNTVIYARSGEGQPFAFLRNYTDLAYYKENPTITVGDASAQQTYKIVSVFYGGSDDSHGKNFHYYDYITAGSEEQNDAFAQELLLRSVINTGVDVNGSDTFVTLHTNYTMYYGGRIVVVARALRPGEDATVDTSAATEAEDPLMAAGWYAARGQKVPTETGPYTALQ